ncbi:MAG: STIV orfB116 family protein [Candidatus Helarchaeota archaeon]
MFYINSKKTKIKISYILNSPVLTDFGTYEFFEYDEKLFDLDFSESKSAIGHKSGAKLISEILNMPIKVNRIKIKMKKGENALVFFLTERLKEGKTLGFRKLKKKSFKMGILSKIG